MTAGKDSTGVKSDKGSFMLRQQRPKILTLREELDLALRTFAKGHATVAFRLRLARLLAQMDRFDEAIKVLGETGPGTSYESLLQLAGVHLTWRKGESDEIAADLLRQAIVLAPSAAQRAQALAELGRAELHRGRRDDAKEVLLEALATDPVNADAFRRLSQMALEDGNPQYAVDLADGMLARNVLTTRALAIRAGALHALGRLEEAEGALGLQAFGYRSKLAVPAGWATQDDFHHALHEEFDAHPGRRYERYGTA